MIRRRLHQVAARAERLVRGQLALTESDRKLTDDAQEFWNDEQRDNHRSDSHWRGAGGFADDTLWLGLGRMHLSLVEHAASWVSLEFPVERIVEWGAGGGMNAVQFAPRAREFVAVDIADSSLGECERQMTAMGSSNGQFIRIDAHELAAVIDHVRGPCDIFLSTYVFELLPTPDYAISVMRIALRLLRPGGIALVQIRYHGRRSERSRRFAYARNSAFMTTFTIPGFWQATAAIGFEPLFVRLLPEQPELNERRYAYFAMAKSPVSILGDTLGTA